MTLRYCEVQMGITCHFFDIHVPNKRNGRLNKLTTDDSCMMASFLIWMITCTVLKPYGHTTHRSLITISEKLDFSCV